MRNPIRIQKRLVLEFIIRQPSFVTKRYIMRHMDYIRKGTLDHILTNLRKEGQVVLFKKKYWGVIR